MILKIQRKLPNLIADFNMPRKHQQSYGNHVQVPEDLSGQAWLTMWNHFSQKDGCFDPELVPRHQIKTKPGKI